MNRIIVIAFGLAGGLWVLHDVGTVQSAASPSRQTAVASIAPVPQLRFDDTQTDDGQPAVAEQEQAPGKDLASVNDRTPAAEDSPADGPPAAKLEFPAPRVESNRAAEETGTYSEDETCGTAHPPAPSKTHSPAANSTRGEPALTQSGSPEIGAPADAGPDRAAIARWLAESIAELRTQIVVGVDSFAVATGAEAKQLPKLAQQNARVSAEYVADQARALKVAQGEIAKPSQRKFHYTQSKPTYKTVAASPAVSASQPTQLPAGKPTSEVTFVPEPKTAADAATAPATAPSPANVAPSHRKQSPPPQPVYKQPALSPELEVLAGRVHRALALYRHERLLNTGVNSTWEVMHRVVAFGIPTEVHRDSPDGEPVNAIGWLLWGGRCTGQPLMILQNGRPQASVGVGVQGHPGQFLGMLAQSRVSPDSPFQLQGKHFTVRDLIDEEKLNCDTQMELTFKLIAFSYYLKSDDQWTANDGGRWSIARLVHEELKQPIQGAACGGTHRLFGLSSSYKMRIARGEPIDGEFLRAQKYVHDYQRYTLYRLRNPDGSFSTDWFKRPADSGDPARKLQTTGHMLEWLVFSLEDDQLRDPRVEQTVDFIATLLIRNPDKQWSIGPLGHALHALAMYDNRVFGAADPVDEPQQDVARRPADRSEPAATDSSATGPRGSRANSRPAAEQQQPRVHPPARRPYEAPVAESVMASASR